MSNPSFNSTGVKARVAIKFIVVGGSIAGLATAYALRQAGHDVLVVEKGNGKERSSGGLRSPPNMTKILSQWGLGPSLAELSRKCKQYKFRNGFSGEYLGKMTMTDSIRDHVLSDMLFLRHGDLQSLLFNLASESGIDFLFDSEVVGIDTEAMVITLKGGKTLSADVVVGADGHNSTVRPLAIGEDEFVADDEHNCFVTFEVPADVLRADEELASLTDPTEWMVWFGDRFLVHANLMADGRNLSVSITHQYPHALKRGDESWRPRSFDEFGIDTSRFAPRLQKLSTLAKNVSGKVYRFFPPVESLVCDNSRVVLVGEAGHPLLPSSHHNTALCIEDAQTLGLLFSHIRSNEQVPQFLNAFEEIRQPRLSFASNFENTQRRMTFVPAGPIMEERDAMMRAALAFDDWEQMDEDTFRLVWEEELALVSHDAAEKVEDWWTQWGAFFDSKDSSGRRKSIVEVTVLRDQTNKRPMRF